MYVTADVLALIIPNNAVLKKGHGIHYYEIRIVLNEDVDFILLF